MVKGRARGWSGHVRCAVCPQPLVNCLATGVKSLDFMCRDLPLEAFQDEKGALSLRKREDRKELAQFQSRGTLSSREELLVHGAQIVSGSGGIGAQV